MNERERKNWDVAVDKATAQCGCGVVLVSAESILAAQRLIKGLPAKSERMYELAEQIAARSGLTLKQDSVGAYVDMRECD
jgi:hypothetical protein